MHCADVRGFNYDGSWGTSALDLWQHHDHGTMAVEIARGKRYFPGWNLCRWWLSQQAYQRNPARFLANFEAGLTLFAHHDILVMPLLFNRWRDPVCDFGGVSLEHIAPGLSYGTTSDDLWQYVGNEAPRKPAPIQHLFDAYLRDVVGTHKDDKRIYAWDLCNEPMMAPYLEDDDSPIRAAELRWLTWTYRTCKDVGATQPLTIGNFPHMKALELTEPISDLLSTHPYYVWNREGASKAEFEASLDAYVAFAESVGKELLASETVWGAVEDAKRVEVLRYTLGELRKRNIGFVVHALQHSLVADLHYPAYGPIGSPETLHFVNPDGSLRPGHDAWNDYA